MSTMIRCRSPLPSLARFSGSRRSNSEPSRIERPHMICGISASFLASTKARAAALERADPSRKTPRPLSHAVAVRNGLSLRSMRLLSIVTVRCCCSHKFGSFKEAHARDKCTSGRDRTRTLLIRVRFRGRHYLDKNTWCLNCSSSVQCLTSCGPRLDRAHRIITGFQIGLTLAFAALIRTANRPLAVFSFPGGM